MGSFGLLFGHDDCFHYGDFADYFYLHDRARLDGPVIARQMRRRLSVDRRRDYSAEEVRCVETAQRYFLRIAPVFTGDRP